MSRAASWPEILLPAAGDREAWETLHESSKMSPYEELPSDQEAAAWMQGLAESLSFDLQPAVALPAPELSLDLPLSRALAARATPAELTRAPLGLDQLATLLWSACGVRSDPAAAPASPGRRALRMVPSAGALYPLEVFFHTRSVPDLAAGLYYYDPVRHELRRVREGDQTAKIASLLVQKRLAVESSLLVFLVALFTRTVGKYGERGYRFVLLEAGHLAQSLCLAATGLGLGAIPVGGYFDRRADSLLGLDGLLQSTVYMTAIGGIAS